MIFNVLINNDKLSVKDSKNIFVLPVASLSKDLLKLYVSNVHGNGVGNG